MPFANSGAHIATPELGGHTGDDVFYCFPSGRHVTRRMGWADDIRESLARALRRAKGRVP
jgi:hypothetical protein